MEPVGHSAQWVFRISIIPDDFMYLDGLYYVCSALLATGQYHVDMCDMYRGDTPANYDLSQYDAILISALARHLRGNKALMQGLSQRAGKIPVIIGGSHATFAPYDVLRYADFAVIGYGEIAIQRLLECIFEGPYPVADNVPSNIAVMADVNFARGCPHNCNFCYGRRIHGRQLVKQNVERIAQELADIKQATECSCFFITDLTFGCDKAHTRRYFETIGHKGYEFIALTRVTMGDDPDLIRGLHDAGLMTMCLGIEAIDQSVLSAYNKGVEADKQKERVLAFWKNGVAVTGSFIFGAENQSDDDGVNFTAQWALEAEMIAPIFACYADYPHQNTLYGAYQEIPDWRLMFNSPAFHHPVYVSTFSTTVRPSVLQRRFIDGYRLFFDKALSGKRSKERKFRETRLWNHYMRDIAYPQMEKYAQYLTQIESPYYDNRDNLLEERLMPQDSL